MAQPEIVWQESHAARGFLFLNGDNTQQTILDSEGNILCNLPLPNANGSQSMGLLKYDTDGNLLWEYTYIDTASVRSRLNYMTLDNDDNILIMGYTITEEIIDYDLAFVNGQGVLAKVSKNGEFLWEYIINGFEQIIPEINHAIVDDENNIYITGEEANPTGTNFTYQKLSTDGDLLFSVSNPDAEKGLTLDKRDNQITVLGITNGVFEYQMFVYDESSIIGQKSFEVETGVTVKPWFDDDGNIFVRDRIGSFHLVKFDSFGNKQWSFEEPTNLPDNVFADELRGLAFDADKNIIITGRHYGENYGDPENYTNGDILTIQLSPDGEEMRRHRYMGIGDNNAEIGTDVIVYEDGGVYVAGTVFTGLGNPTDAFGMYLDENWEKAWMVDYDFGDNQDDRVIEAIALDNCIITKGYSYADQSYHVLTKYDLTTSLEDFKNTDLDLKIFPNPFIHQISFSDQFRILNAYDQAGAMIPFDLNGHTIEFSQALPSGKYYLSFQDEKSNIITQRVIKI